MATAAVASSIASDLDVLHDLNRNYVRSVEQSDVRWFDQHLAADFMNTNPDGAVIDRAAFLAQIGRGSPVKDIHRASGPLRICP